jgi:pimeloyl-ACP methyl ester carboxylesterase
MGLETRFGGLHAVVRGSGPVLVLLHGNGEDGRIFDSMLEPLSGFTTVTLDARAHGRTPRGDAPLTITNMAADLAAALDEITAAPLNTALLGDGVPTASEDDATPIQSRNDTVPAPPSNRRLPIVLGFSDGANVATEMMLKFPRPVAALVLVGGNLREECLKPGVRLGMHAIHGLWRVAGLVSPRARARAEVWSLCLGQPNQSESELARIPVPTLVVIGDKDIVTSDTARRTAEALPKGQHLQIPGQDHFLPLNAPTALAAAVRRFLDESM